MKIKVLAIFWVFVFALAAAGQERFVRPVDEASKDASFLAFRTKLIAAAERKDARYIYSIIDRDIQISFGLENGAAAFKKYWKPESKDSKFWDQFLRVIRNGGAFTGEGRGKRTSFAAPHTYTNWGSGIDDIEFSAIFGNNVNLREAGSKDAKVIGQLSYNVVRVDWNRSVRARPGDEESEVEWFFVETMGGLKGFVYKDYVRSPLDFRAGFEKKRGVWKMTFFVAGD